MSEPGDVVSDTLVDVRDEVTDDGRPQVSHVEGLGHVGGAGKQQQHYLNQTEWCNHLFLSLYFCFKTPSLAIN